MNAVGKIISCELTIRGCDLVGVGAFPGMYQRVELGPNATALETYECLLNIMRAQPHVNAEDRSYGPFIRAFPKVWDNIRFAKIELCANLAWKVCEIDPDCNDPIVTLCDGTFHARFVAQYTPPRD